MKKLCMFLLLLLCVTTAFGQMTVLWEKTAVNGTMPGWFDATHLTRGLAYGKVGGQDRLYVVTRNGGGFVYKLDAATGDTVGQMNTYGMSLGTYTLNDAGVSADGILYVGNLCLGTTADTLFRVYKWTADTLPPVLVVNYINKGIRLGDKFTVTGSAIDNSLIIWAASSTAGQKKVYKFTTADNGATFTPTVITLDMGAVDVSGSASIGPLPDGSFYWNAGGRSAMKFNADGTLKGTIPGSVVATGSSAIRYFGTINGCEFFLTHQYGTGNENARIVKVPMGDPTKAETYAITPSQRLNANTNGVGDVDFKDNGDGTFTVYVLSTNNGYGAYVIDPQYMAGDYYVGALGTAPGSANPHFAGLKTAFDGLNKQKINGNVNLYITSDIDEPNTVALGFLGLAVDPGQYTITIKPLVGIQPKINLAYPADATDGPSGAFIIGIPELGTASHHINWPDIRPTRNIIIDGSNTVGGTTRDLTIQNLTTSVRNGFPMLLVGDVANVTIKNCNIYYQAQGVTTSGNLFVSALQIRSRNQDLVDRVPNNILIENNHISSNFAGVCQSAQGIGFYQSGTPVPASYPWAITIKNNLIEGTRRAIALYKAGSVDIIGNEIKLNQQIAGSLSSEAIYSVDVLPGSSINILGNKITQVAGMLTSGTSIVNALSVESYGTHYVYNNMITGFEVLGSTPAGTVNAVKNSSGNAAVYFYHNTMCLNDLADGGLGNLNYNAFTHGNGYNVLYSNIFAIADIDFKTYMLYFSGTPVAGSLISDQNDFWFHDGATMAQFSNYGGDDPTWNNWRSTGNDVHSVQKNVNFVSGTDLHLTGTSIGDNDLGCSTVGVTTDIDGEERPAYTYMGADEASQVLTPQNVYITLLANTAGVPDTMQTYSTVQLRGSWPFTWDNTSQGIMTNIGGDYWSYTYTIPRDSLQKNFEYKFCTFPVDLARLTSEMNGWESANNRVLDMKTFAGIDTTLPLQYVDGWKSGGEYSQFDKPFTTTDSIDVYVRVDAEALMKAQAFDPTTEKIGLRGSNAFDSWSGTADFNWNKTLYFAQENNHTNGIWGSTYNGTYFFNGVIRCPQEWVGKEIQYKFIIGDAWGRNEDNNRSFVLPADGSDVTVHWVWYNNVPPAGFTGKDTSDITFSADMTKAIANNGFEIGDPLLVKYGYFGSSVEVKTATMTRLSGSQNYFVTVSDVPLSFGKPLYYQYYMIKNTAEQREVYFNFDYTGSVPSEAERRVFTVTSVTTVIGDIQDSDVDARRMPIFRNNQLLSQAVTLTVECDLRPAIFQVKAGSTLDDIQSSFDITPAMLTEKPDTVFTLGLYMNGPLSNNAEGTWATWGGTLAADTTRKMFDDGTHGDVVAGDTVYTLTYLLDPAKSHRIGQEFKYGIGGGDNESGYGLNHIENIDDTNPTYTLYTQWGSINPNFYDAWDFDNPRPRSDIRKDNIPVVTKYALDQNFPNPFNPTTQIRFSVPERSDATLTIYNALGQMVNKVVFTNLNNGVYSYFWDGKDLRGNTVASGVYLYELRAGDKFRDLKKMVLLK